MGLFDAYSDLTSFAKAFTQGKLINKDAMKEMLTPHIEMGEWSYQGLGFFIENTHPLIYVHPGSVAGRSAALLLAGDENPLTVVCLSNTNEGVNVVGDVIRLLKGEDVQIPWKSESIEKNHALYVQLGKESGENRDKIKQIIENSNPPPFVLKMIADQF